MSISSGASVQGDENYVYATLNEPVTFSLLGKDDGSLTYEFINNSAGATFGAVKNDGTIDVSFTVTDTTPVYIR